MERWRGQIVVVTGASSGIGRATCLHLVEAGMKVVALARREDRLKELEKEAAQKRGPGSLKGLRCDLCKESDIKEAFAWVDKHLGNVSVLINNAGYLKPCLLFTDGDNSEAHKIFNTNVLGLITCTKEAVSRMIKNGVTGHVINVNSVAGHQNIRLPGVAVYQASKHGVTSLNESLRNELAGMGTKIRVTSVSPGLVFTEMTDPFKHTFTAETPGLQSDDVADCIIFALSTPPHVNISELTVQPTGENIHQLPNEMLTQNK